MDYHRNGICGAPFYVFLFRDNEQKRNMVATVFDESAHCAVFDVDLLAQGNIKFGENSWRGDNYEGELRNYIALKKRKSITNTQTGGIITRHKGKK